MEGIAAAGFGHARMTGSPDRLQFPVLQPESCDGCGLCCVGIGSPVLLYQTRPEEPHPFRPDQLPLELIEEIDRNFRGLSRGQEPKQQCLWFDADRRCCKHYEWRPQICREYELGGQECLRERKPYVSD